MKKRENLLRFIAVGVIFCAVCLIYVGRLIYLQVAGQDYYTMAQPTTYVTRRVPIQAIRGEIYDRNGVALVTNEYTYDLQLDYGSFPGSESEKNAMVLDLLEAAERHGAEAQGYGSMPVTADATSQGVIVSFRGISLPPAVRGSGVLRLWWTVCTLTGAPKMMRIPPRLW